MGSVRWLVLAGLLLTTRYGESAQALRPRLLVLTDIGGDPDDQQSMIRLLVHANEFEIEGLIATASGTPGELKEHVTKPELIRELIDAYAVVLPNLRKHAEGFPAAETLHAVVRSGNPNRGREFIGSAHDTQGSRWLIELADKQDSRPLNVVIWGGQTDLAQALWRVREDRGAAGLHVFQSRIRVFDIDDQDRIRDWFQAEFPDVFYVLSKAPPGADKRDGAYRGMYLGGDQSLTSREWVDAHVRLGHGPLGALYPTRTWTAPNPHSTLKEGDTPSWFFFLPNGLSEPTHPEWGGWGGRYVHSQAGLFRDGRDTVGAATEARATVWRWRTAFQADFAARMDWCVADEFARANHHPIAILNNDSSKRVLELSGKSGDAVTLSASGSRDPDDDDLQKRWWIYREAGTVAELPSVAAEFGDQTRLILPPIAGKESSTLHMILEVTDSGTPPLTSYRRVVINIRP